MYHHAVAIIEAMVQLATGKAVVVVITVIISAIVVVAVIVVLVLGVTRYCKYYECKLASTLPNIKTMYCTMQQNKKRLHRDVATLNAQLC